MSTELVTLSKTEWPILANAQEIAAAIQQNMAGEAISADLLTRIHVPAGGGTMWTFVDDSGEDQAHKELEGVILHIARRRAYWVSREPSGEPPQCASSDMIHGVGDPSGACDTCPNDIFGSNGRAKACKEQKLIFLLRADHMLPDIVSIPSASLRTMAGYQLRLTPHAYWQVLTSFVLEKARNADGIDYAKVKPLKKGILDPEIAESLRLYAQAMHSVFSSAARDFQAAGLDKEPVEV